MDCVHRRDQRFWNRNFKFKQGRGMTMAGISRRYFLFFIRIFLRLPAPFMIGRIF